MTVLDIDKGNRPGIKEDWFNVFWSQAVFAYDLVPVGLVPLEPCALAKAIRSGTLHLYIIALYIIYLKIMRIWSDPQNVESSKRR